jgi:hypothetical protein
MRTFRLRDFVLGLALVPFGVAALAQGQPQAGISAAVRGQVQVAALGAAPGAVGRLAKSGEQIFIGDRIRSGATSAMQVVLLDETVFTIGADSDIVIDEFVYDPSTNVGKVSASVGRGAFRFITGKIAQNRPENMEVRTPNAVIGVRGTIVYGFTDDTRSVIALGGPGGNNNANERIGAADVRNRATPPGPGVGVSLKRNDFAAVVDGIGQPVLQPFDAGLRNLVFSPLAASQRAGTQGASGQAAGGAGGADGGAANTQSGQATASGLIASLSQASIEANFAGIKQNSTEAIQQASSEPFGPDGQTKFDQLRQLNASNGIGVYNAGGATTALSGTGGAGTYVFVLNIDFGQRVATGGFTQINIPTGGNAMSNGSIMFSPTNYTNSPGSSSVFFSASGACASSTCSGSVSMFNLNGRVAIEASHFLNVSGGGTSSGGGVATRP